MNRVRQTKIIATLGPSSSSDEVLEKIILAGADIVRLNFSHGDHDDHEQVFHSVRRIASRLGHQIDILADLQGPKIRIGTFLARHVHLIPGQTFFLDQQDFPGTEERVYLPHREIFEAVGKDDLILLDDGKIRLRVRSNHGDSLETQVELGGTLSNRKGVNLPTAVLPLASLTYKDEKDLDFALGLGVDSIAISFVQTAHDIDVAKQRIDQRARVIAKIEKPQALDHLDPITTASEGLMVARGDLGVELPIEQVPTWQRMILKAAQRYGKFTIVATQMLESMIHHPTPTRAEVNDIATAVLQGANAVMLSAETASGHYPVEAVSMMRRVIEYTEDHKDHF